MGNFIRPLSEQVTLIASDDTWIEGNAIQQLHTTAGLNGMTYVAGMPDLHAGRGYPIGAAFFSQGRLYPALVGNDIGCGMSLWHTDIQYAKLHLDKLEKQLGSIDGPMAADLLADYIPADLVDSDFSNALGTIGGGNHFAEFQQIDQIYNATIYNATMARDLALSKKHLMLLVHSGSRGLGQSILRQHIEGFNHHGLAEDSAECGDYLAQHNSALRFAEVNRMLIAQRILLRLRAEGSRLLDVHHNLLSPATIRGVNGWLHRKGATPADCGPVVVPGSRGDYSYLVMPIASESSLFSLAHGAGRKWMRSECKARLSSRYSAEQLSRTRFNSRVICRDRQLIYEEAPEAYKSIDSVINAMSGAGLIEIIARLKPVFTYKTTGEGHK